MHCRLSTVIRVIKQSRAKNTVSYALDQAIWLLEYAKKRKEDNSAESPHKPVEHNTGRPGEIRTPVEGPKVHYSFCWTFISEFHNPSEYSVDDAYV